VKIEINASDIKKYLKSILIKEILNVSQVSYIESLPKSWT